MLSPRNHEDRWPSRGHPSGSTSLWLFFIVRYHDFIDTVPFPSEAMEYARQLGIVMVKNNKTKLRQINKSSLFKTAVNEIDIFFSDEALATNARNAAPIKYTGGILSFTHKVLTFQREFVL